MTPELTPQEIKDLIWSKHDFIEIISGRIEFTRMEEFERYKWATFMFESDSAAWSTREWQMSIGDRVPNGPALLALYRTGKLGYPFGIVSLTNGAWTHAWPLIDRPFYNKSTRNRWFRFKVAMARLGLPVLGLINILGATWFTQTLQTWVYPMGPAAQSIGSLTIASPVVDGGLLAIVTLAILEAQAIPNYLMLIIGLHTRDFTEQLEQSARGLMWRIARDSKQYLDPQNTLNGRL